MRFDDLQPVELPGPGAILAEWCDACRAVTLQRVTLLTPAPFADLLVDIARSAYAGGLR